MSTVSTAEPQAAETADTQPLVEQSNTETKSVRYIKLLERFFILKFILCFIQVKIHTSTFTNRNEINEFFRNLLAKYLFFSHC